MTFWKVPLARPGTHNLDALDQGCMLDLEDEQLTQDRDSRVGVRKVLMVRVRILLDFFFQKATARPASYVSDLKLASFISTASRKLVERRRSSWLSRDHDGSKST